MAAYLSRDVQSQRSEEGGGEDPLAKLQRVEEEELNAELVAQQWDYLVKRLPEEHMQLLNLAHLWLHSVLPHVLCKVARVHFGLLPETALPTPPPLDAGEPRLKPTAISLPAHPSLPSLPSKSAAPADGAPQSRRLLAVPFVGKDVPSHAAEFSHPDALIGLTVMAYRHQGMRRGDFKGLMNLLLEQMEQESGPYRERPTCRLYSRWIALAGGRVRGTTGRAQHFRAARTGGEDGEAGGGGGASASPTHPPDNGVSAGCAEFGEIWPLQLINPCDSEQMDVLYTLLHKLPHAVGHYLEQLVFPLTMQHQSRKLSANGQDLTIIRIL